MSFFADQFRLVRVVAALRVAGRLGSCGTAATIACDPGLKYLSTDLYSAG